MAKSPRKRPRPETSGNKPDTYQVGPGNPPLESRFKPGQSGNPAGRPKKDRTLAEALEAELNAPMDVVENGVTLRLTKRAVIIKQLTNLAVQGNFKAVELVFRKEAEARQKGNETQDVSVSRDEILRFLARNTGQADAGK